MINIVGLKSDQLGKILLNVGLEANHVHLAEREDRWTSKYHSHNNYEFCYVVRGRGLYCLNGKKYNVEPGDIFVAKPGQKHYEACDQSDPYELIFLTITIWKKNKRIGLNKLFKLPARLHIVPEKKVNNIFLGILDEILLGNTGYTVKIGNYLADLIIEIYRFLYVKTGKDSSVGILNKDYKKCFAEKICKYIQNNYNKEIGLKDISDDSHLSPQYLSTFFKKQTGYSPMEYLAKIRIDTAKDMLKDSKEKISSIALNVGYDSSHYFHRIFKKVAGITPAQYREKSLSIRRSENL